MVGFVADLVCLCWHLYGRATVVDIRHCSFVFPFVVFGVGGECSESTDDGDPSPKYAEPVADVVKQ
jgi:hypothetical protein